MSDKNRRDAWLKRNSCARNTAGKRGLLAKITETIGQLVKLHKDICYIVLVCAGAGTVGLAGFFGKPAAEPVSRPPVQRVAESPAVRATMTESEAFIEKLDSKRAVTEFGLRTGRITFENDHLYSVPLKLYHPQDARPGKYHLREEIPSATRKLIDVVVGDDWLLQLGSSGVLKSVAEVAEWDPANRVFNIKGSLFYGL